MDAHLLLDVVGTLFRLRRIDDLHRNGLFSLSVHQQPHPDNKNTTTPSELYKYHLLLQFIKLSIRGSNNTQKCAKVLDQLSFLHMLFLKCHQFCNHCIK